MMQTGYLRKPFRNEMFIALACLPLYMAGIAKYGLHLLLALLVSCIVGYATERVAMHIKKEQDTAFGYIYWLLFPLILPPVLPLWMVGFTVLFSTIICIVFFGGFGRHIVTPIAVGWTFAFLSYQSVFGFSWSFPFPGPFDGFSHFVAAVPTIDHPVTFFKARSPIPLLDILIGNFPQVPGNAVPLLLIIVGLLLMIVRAVDSRVVISFAGTVLFLTIIFNALYPETTAAPHSLLVGNFCVAAFIILPDNRTASRTVPGRWLTGILTGIIAFVIRTYSSIPDGVFFAVLFGNVFSPLIDEVVLTITCKGKQ